MYTDFWDSDPKVHCVNVLLCEEMDPNPLPELVVFNLLFCLYIFIFFQIIQQLSGIFHASAFSNTKNDIQRCVFQFIFLKFGECYQTSLDVVFGICVFDLAPQ